jgi:hypothetical protein
VFDTCVSGLQSYCALFADSSPGPGFLVVTANSEFPNVNRLPWLICSIVLLMSPHTLLAQHRGGHGTSAGGGPTEVPDTDALKDFKRAAGLQATPDQVIQFRRLTKSTEVALKGVQDLLHLAESASKPDLFHYANPLTSAVEEAQTDNGEFLHSFSTVQKSGLKDVTKMLGKADSDVAKQRNALAHTLGRSGIGARQIAGVAEELDKALREFQARQLAVGVGMGIQGEESLQ